MLRYLKRPASSLSNSSSAPSKKKIKYSPHHPTDNIKILSFNVNGLKAITKKYDMEEEDYTFASQFISREKQLDNLHYLLKKEQPTLLCLQETKIQKNDHEMYEYRFRGYTGYFASSVKKLGYSGVAIYVKNEWMEKQKQHKSVRIRRGFLAKKQHDEGRIISLEFDHFIILNVYAPNSSSELKRLPYRMQWDKDILKLAQELRNDTGKAVIWTGDLNVSYMNIDVWNPDTRHPRSACWTKEEKEGFQTFLDAGFVDSFRHFYPNKADTFSQWSYRAQNKVKNRGMRLDYVLVTEDLVEGLESAYIMPFIKGSDHCPVGINLKMPDTYLEKLKEKRPAAAVSEKQKDYAEDEMEGASKPSESGDVYEVPTESCAAGEAEDVVNDENQ